jgi:hypothetical protein
MSVAKHFVLSGQIGETSLIPGSLITAGRMGVFVPKLVASYYGKRLGAGLLAGLKAGRVKGFRLN